MRIGGRVFAAGLLILGCGSSGTSSSTANGSASGDGSVAPTGSSRSDAGSCGDSPAVWKEDGVLHCGSSGEAILSTNTTTNPEDGGAVVDTSLEVVILQPSTAYIFTFIVTTPGALGGTYTCAIAPSTVELEYDEVGVFSSTTSSCSVTVSLTPTEGGMVATGTFSAQLAVTDAGVKTLSDGTFTFAVTGE